MNEKDEIAEIVNMIARLAGIDDKLVKAILIYRITELIDELTMLGKKHPIIRSN